MGLFDTFSVPNTKCPSCGHVFEADFQTKEFECMLDHITVGEDVRDKIEQWYLHEWSNQVNNYECKLTIKQAEALARRYPHLYDLRKYDKKDKYNWALYRFAGQRDRNFSWVRYGTFPMYTSCLKCDEWYDAVGLIEDYIFKGIKK